MITRAPGTGSDPTLSMLSGTCASQSSSWRVKVRVLSEYQDPAWEASLDGIMMLRFGGGSGKM